MKKLYTVILKSPAPPSEDDERLAFLLCLINEMLPYEQIDVISISDEEYAERKGRMRDIIDKTRFTERPFMQKTQKASAFYRCN